MDSNERKRTSRNKTKHTRPDEDSTSFIPPHVIDHASQRLFVVSLFVLIQCWKIYDIILVRTTTLTTISVALTHLNNFTFVIKYAIIDGLFLWILPILNIPLITFSPLITLFMTLGMNVFTVILASSVTIPLFANMIIPFWKYLFNKKELTIIGDSVSPSSVVDINSHFKGRYTIHYLPDSSALFNPFHFDKLCLDPDGGAPIMMPIEFNTTTNLGSLQIELITPNQEVNFVNYTKNDLKKILRKDYTHLSKFDGFVSKDSRVFYAEIPITSPGKYKIGSVTDTQGTKIRTYKSEFLIGHCPNAQFIYPFSAERNYKCVGQPDIDDTDFNFPLVKSFGVGPLNIEFKAKSSDGRTHAFNRTIQSDNSGSDVGLMRSESLSRNLLEQEVLRDPSLLSTKAPGKVSFHLSKVTDFLGNYKIYNPLSKDHDVWFEIDLKPILPISISDSDSGSPLLVNSSKVLKLNYESEDTDFPLTVELGYTSTDNPLSSYSFKRVFKNAQELKGGIEVNQEGSYKINHSSNKLCPCKVDETSVDLSLALPPSVDIKAEPIQDKCVGMIGYKFDFAFTGAPPFNVQYQVFKNMSRGALKPVLNEHGLTTRVIKSLNSQHNFEYRPREEGAYIITFKNVKDAYYNKQPVPLDEQQHTYSTYFKQRSSASFFEDDRSTKSISTCFNGSVNVPVYFSGNSPFSFTYDVVNAHTKEKLIPSQKVSNWFNESFIIETPKLVKGGSYSVLLNDVKDSLGCEADFDGKESVTIRARSDIPEISFDETSSLHFNIVEGDSVKIPLKLQSSAGKSNSDKLTYSFTPLHSASGAKQRSISNLGNFIAKEAGTYQLESFSNAGCEGRVLNPSKQVVVNYYPKPNLTIATTSSDKLLQHSEKNSLSMHLKPVCQFCDNKANLQLDGAPPFIVDYDVQLPSGKIDSRSMTINSNQVEIELSSDQNGTYEHRFKAIYDKLYTRAKLSKLGSRNKEFPVIRHDVTPLPNIEFSKTPNFVQICETALKATESSIPPIPIQISGDYPLSIRGTVRHGIGGQVEEFTLDDVSDPFLRLGDAVNEKGQASNLGQHLQVGEHLVTLHEVQDGNGCIRKGLHEKYVIAITESPKIRRSSLKPYYCVGDHISYNMSGVSPFTVYYNFNDKRQKAETSHKFYRLASRPGLLSISALQDSSANHCLVNITEGSTLHDSLSLKVHDLPSVEVSQGENVIRNVHEGDQSEITFSFTGTPPFYLKYIRTIEGDNLKPDQKQRTKKRKQSREVVQTTVVETIWEHEHTIITSLEGTYEAIEVRDAYCTAKRDGVQQGK